MRPFDSCDRGRVHIGGYGCHTYLRFPGYVGFGTYSSFGEYGYYYPPYTTTTYIYTPVYEYSVYDDSAYDDAEDNEADETEDEFLEAAPADESDDAFEEEATPDDGGNASDGTALRQSWFEAEALLEAERLQSEWSADEPTGDEQDIADLQGADATDS